MVSIFGDGGSSGSMLGFWACASSVTVVGVGVSADAASALGFRYEAMARGDSYRRGRNLGVVSSDVGEDVGDGFFVAWWRGECFDDRRYEIHMRWGVEVKIRPCLVKNMQFFSNFLSHQILHTCMEHSI